MKDWVDWNQLLNFKPMPHQVEALDFAVAHQYSINGFRMGYGKTLVGIMLSLRSPMKNNTLVVCPAFLKRNWEKEFHKFSKRKLKVRVLFSQNFRSFKDPNEYDVIIVNYEILSKCEDLFKWADIVLADESHYLANPNSQRTMAFAQYMETRRPNRLLMMSGSPIRGKVPQWFAPLHICSLDPSKTNGVDIRKTPYDSYWNFQKHFCNEKIMQLGNRSITKFEGLRNVDTLKKILKNKYLRKVPSFNLKLPPIFEKEIEVDYSNMDEDLQEAWEQYEAGKKISDHVSSAKKSSAINKVPFTFNYCRNIIEAGEGPVVIYSDHVDPVKNLSAMFKDRKYKSAYICGDVPTEQRDVIVTSFQDNKLDVLVATIGAASTGLTLTAAKNLVFNDISWINTENEQAKKRIHRIGQDEECVIHFILGSQIDKMILKTVASKDKVVQQTVDI